MRELLLRLLAPQLLALQLLAPQLLADRDRAKLRRQCATLVIEDRHAAGKGGAA